MNRALRGIGTSAILAQVAHPAIVSAHGREPNVGLVAFDPVDPSHLVARTTWALLESRDDGVTWTWRCAERVGFDRFSEDPPLTLVASGAVVLGTFDGIVHGDPLGCEWSPSADPDAWGAFVIDVDRDPHDPATVWAAVSPGAVDNTIVRSSDGGETWDVLAVPRAGAPRALLERLALAPSDPLRVYVTAAVPVQEGFPTRRAYFYRSDDGGQTYAETELPLEGEERNAHVLAVDPTDADRVFVRMTRRVTDEIPERLLVSEDGGATWMTTATLLEITGFAISDDGRRVWVGGWDGAFLRSDTGGAAGTFAPVGSAPDLRVRCLAWRATESEDGELWVCADGLAGGFAIARSSDLGETLVPAWSFTDATPDTACSSCSSIGASCLEHWPDVIADLALDLRFEGLDAGLAGFDGGTCDDTDASAPDASEARPDAGPARLPPTGCACAAPGPGEAPLGRRLPSWVALVALALAMRRGRRLVPTTAMSTVFARLARRSGMLALVLLTAGVCSSPMEAHAHGREPMVGQVAFHPSDREHFILRGTWALLTTHDDGETFTWTCAVAADFDRLSEDPPTVITESGYVALGTFDGLRRSSTVAACEYEDGPPTTRGAFVIDVQADPHDPRAIWAVYSPGNRENTILLSRDEGETFEVTATFERGILLERVRVAPSDAMRVYVTGATPSMGEEPRHAFFHRSIDGGRTFEAIEIPLLLEERNAHVLAVDPDDANRVLVRMTRSVTDEVFERLLLTEDGGETFRTVLEALEIVSVAFGHDGSSVWAGSWDGGLFRSEDGGASFEPLDAELRVRCLAERESATGGSELFVCVDELVNDYAVARSYDGGETLEPMWGFADVTNDVGCDRCTVVGAICPSYWPDVIYDLSVLGGVDGGRPPGPTDAGAAPMCGEGGVPFDAAIDAASMPTGGGETCACALATRGSRWGWGWLAFGLLALRVVTRRASRNQVR